MPFVIDNSDDAFPQAVFMPSNFLNGSPFTTHMTHKLLTKYIKKGDTNHPLCESLLEPEDLLSSAITGLTMNEAGADTSDDEKFEVKLEVYNFLPDEIDVKVVNGMLVVKAIHEEKPDYYGYVTREFVRSWTLPKECSPDAVESSMSADGILTITAPKDLPSSGGKKVPTHYKGYMKQTAFTNNVYAEDDEGEDEEAEDDEAEYDEAEDEYGDDDNYVDGGDNKPEK